MFEIDSEYAPAYHLRGLAYKEQNQVALAISDFELYLEISTDPIWRERVDVLLQELLEGTP